MPDIRTAHTAYLTLADRQAIRRLMDDAFEGCFSAEDWDNTLCGIHVLVSEQ